MSKHKGGPRKPPAAGKATTTAGSPTAATNLPVSPLGNFALVVAALAAAVAVGFGVFFYLSPDTTMQDVQRVAKMAANGDLKVSDLGKGMGLSDREMLQQGRRPKHFQKDVCKDSGGAMCYNVKADKCEADEELRKRCCRSCHSATCVDKHEECYDWSMTDQCLDNPEFMKRECCFSCSPDPDDPCSIDPMRRPDVYKGDINKTFERIEREYASTITVHSRDPWLITLDNLLDDEECAGIIEAVGGKHGEYIKPSTTAKPVRQANGQVVLTDVPDQIRTSHNAWCQHRSCYDHPIHERVIRRIMGIVDLPPNNAEHMQLLKYGPNEYYRLHHDWIPEQLDAACGPRAFTFFLYLSDVTEGGGTRFPYIGKTVTPKKGMAVLWPHGLDSDPRTKDTRTHHEAMPVIQGSKYAANYWIHGSDFKVAMASGCDGRQGQPKRSRMIKKGGGERRIAEDAKMRKGR
jgi:hypothetical protein